MGSSRKVADIEGFTRVPIICALVAMSLVWLSGTFALAERPNTEDPIFLEARHAEHHAEPSDEDLEAIARMPRRSRAADRKPAQSASVGFPNRGLLRYGVRINDDKTLRVKEGSTRTRHGTAELVRLIESAAHEVAFRYPNARLTVGDLSQKTGGRFYPHKSHQSGRDVDLGFYMLNRGKEPVNFHRFMRFDPKGLAYGQGELYRFDSARNWALMEAALSHPTIDVQHIFVVNTVKRKLLRHAAKVGAAPQLIMKAKRVITQPRRGAPHRTHFHMRIFCADDDQPRCKDRPPFYAWHEKPGTGPALSELKPDES
jgi:penicillin-insensitive murein endopeptidase